MISRAAEDYLRLLSEGKTRASPRFAFSDAELVYCPLPMEFGDDIPGEAGMHFDFLMLTFVSQEYRVF